MLATVRAAPGVQAAEAQQLGVAVVVGAQRRRCSTPTANRAIPIALAWQDDARRSTRWSSSPGTRRVRPTRSSSTARRSDKGQFVVGEKVHVVEPGRLAARTGSPASRPTAAPTAPPARRWWRSRRRPRRSVLGTPGRYTAIQVVAAAGRVAGAAGRRTCTPALHEPDVEVITGAAGDRAKPQRPPVRRCSSSTCS